MGTEGQGRSCHPPGDVVLRLNSQHCLSRRADRLSPSACSIIGRILWEIHLRKAKCSKWSSLYERGRTSKFRCLSLVTTWTSCEVFLERSSSFVRVREVLLSSG